MLNLRGPRMRAFLAVSLVIIIGLTVYQIGISVWANHQYNSACEALERFDFEQATVCLQKCLSIRPTYSEARLLAAQTARRRGDFEEAKRQLTMAETHGSPRDILRLERQLLQIQMGNLTNTTEMVQYCTDHPQLPQVEQIVEALIEGSLRTPLMNLRTAKWGVDLWLENHRATIAQAQGLVWRGRFWELNQDWPQALADYRRALELVPSHFQAGIHLVDLLIRQDPRQAIADLDRLRRHFPENLEVRLQTARLLRNLGQPEEAGNLLDAVLAAAPDKVPALIERGRVAMDLHRPQDAERWLLRALSLAPEVREVNLVLSDCYRQAGKADEAKAYQSKTQEIEGRLAELAKKAANVTSGKK